MSIDRVSGPDVALEAFISPAAGANLGAQTAAPQEPRFEVVVDNPGLTGLYDFDLQFLPPDPLSARAAAGRLPVFFYLVASDVPPLLTSIQEQLGLELQPARGAVEYVVIESIERPSED